MTETRRVPTTIQRFAKSLVVTAKAVLLYPPSSNMPLQTAKAAADALVEALAEFDEVVIGVTKTGFEYEGIPISAGVAAYRSLALDFYQRRVAEIIFHPGTGAKELVGFLTVLDMSPEDLERAGGYENKLWEMQIGTIALSQVHISIAVGNVDLNDDVSRLDDVEFEGAEETVVDRSRLTLQRFTADHEQIAAKLLAGWGNGGQDGLDAMAAAFVEFANLAKSAKTEEEQRLVAGDLKESLFTIDPAVRRKVMAQRILAEATTNSAVGGILKDIGLKDVAQLLLRGVGEDEISRSGISRAIRIMSQVSGESREDAAAVFSETMRDEGIREGVISGVLQDTAPVRVVMRRPHRTESAPVAAAVKLVNLVPAADRGESVHSEDVTALLEEVRVGISDGDVVMALLALCHYDVREGPFSSTMSVLEDSLDVLLGRGDLEKAAEAVEALRTLSQDLNLSPSQRRRVEGAVGKLTKPSDVQTIIFALRHQPVGSLEHEAAHRLLQGLGPYAIDSLITRLGDEPDMAMRKTIVEVLSELAPGHIEDLGTFVNNPRWYVVRNVVSVLGSVKDPASVRFLRKAMRHIEARVRREVVRALGGMPFNEAYELLPLALNDQDAQVVQLAAKFLGSARSDFATAALGEVARGQGGGNREMGPRIEAIDALSRIGGVEAMSILQPLAKKRTFGGGGVHKDVRAAAETALARISAMGGGHQ